MSIVLDTASSAYRGTGATSHTFSFTVGNNANRGLALFIHCFDGDYVSGVTYAGVSMTQLNKVKRGTEANYTYMYYLVAPTTGANNFVVSLSVSARIAWASLSIYNAVQSTPTVKSTDGGNGTSSTLSNTSTVNGSWHVIGVGTNASSINSRTNYSSDSSDASNGVSEIGHYVQTTAGALSQGASWTGTNPFGSNGFVIAPDLSDLTVSAPLLTITNTFYAPTLSFIDPVTVSAPLFTITNTFYAPSLQIGIWSNQSKNTATWSAQTKNTATWTNQDKT